MRNYPSAVLVLLMCQVTISRAETTKESQLTAVENELVSLMTEYHKELDTYWPILREYKTPEARQKAVDNGQLVDPSIQYIPRLLSFEEEHRGEDIGLIALWHLFRRAAGAGKFDAPAIVGRRKAATRLHYYGKSKLLPVVTRIAMAGYYEPSVQDSAVKLSKSQAIPQSNRDWLTYFWAINTFKTQDWRNDLVRRLKALRDGSENAWAGELKHNLSMISLFPSEAELEARYAEAIPKLEELTNNDPSPRWPGIEGVDERYYVIRPIKDKSQPLLAEKATAALFKERHLEVDAQAPDLEVTLLDNTAWRLSEHLGKVVVVQFSFTGCGPCEQMYPHLAELTEKYPDRLAVLTIMRDKTPDKALESIKNGKLTWSVSLDGEPGRIATKWSVNGFPTTYVIDPSGKIAAIDSRGEQLQEKVGQLVKQDAEQAVVSESSTSF